MAHRVVIDSSAASPFRVGVAGVDAATAEFNDLIFDANQPPLRLWGTGFIDVAGFSFNQHSGGQNMVEGTPAAVVSVPSGLSPVFLTVVRNQSSNPNNLVSSPGSNFGGGGVCSNFFVPVNYQFGPPSLPDNPGPSIYVNYAIMKNYN